MTTETSSGKELGEIRRTKQEIGQIAWKGIQALVYTKVKDGSMGNNENMLRMAMHAEIPGLPFRPWISQSNDIPETIRILELIEFCWRNIGHPAPSRNDHDAIFDVELGRRNFREDVERILDRNGLAYTLSAEGHIERIPQPL